LDEFGGLFSTSIETWDNGLMGILNFNMPMPKGCEKYCGKLDAKIQAEISF
jgi:hypothetical protein